MLPRSLNEPDDEVDDGDEGCQNENSEEKKASIDKESAQDFCRTTVQSKPTSASGESEGEAAKQSNPNGLPKGALGRRGWVRG